MREEAKRKAKEEQERQERLARGEVVQEEKAPTSTNASGSGSGAAKTAEDEDEDSGSEAEEVSAKRCVVVDWHALAKVESPSHRAFDQCNASISWARTEASTLLELEKEIA